MKKLAILGEFNPSSETHAATNAAIEHSKQQLESNLDVRWVPTDEISPDLLKSFTGFFVAPGSPYTDMDNAISAIAYAREKKMPILGTCGGFQHMIIEYARNVLHFKNAQHEEYSPEAPELFISKLTCSLRGKEMDLNIVENSRTASLYGELRVKEKYYCNFGVNPEYVDLLRKGPIRFVGSDSEGELRILEHPEHPFYIGTLYVPQTNSTEEKPHPIITGLLQEILK